MANRYYGLDRGEHKTDVTEGSSSTATTDVEIRIDLAPGMNRAEVLILIDEIKSYIIEDIWPPA